MLWGVPQMPELSTPIGATSFQTPYCGKAQVMHQKPKLSTPIADTTLQTPAATPLWEKSQQQQNMIAEVLPTSQRSPS